jgi:hypothetical protein
MFHDYWYVEQFWCRRGMKASAARALAYGQGLVGRQGQSALESVRGFFGSITPVAFLGFFERASERRLRVLRESRRNKEAGQI